MRLLSKLGITAGSIALSVTALFIVASVTAPTVAVSKDQYTLLEQNETFKVEVDEKTKHITVDKDGDTIAGAIFKITPAEPLKGGGMEVASFVNSVVAPCGYEGVILLESKRFSPSGEMIGSAVEIKKYEVQRDQPSVSAVVYDYLCKGIPRNNSGDGYKSQWI